MSTRPVRVSSAHPTTGNRQRPLSGLASLTFSRRELIENVYTAQPRPTSGKSGSAKGWGSLAAEGIEKSKRIVVKQSRRKEQLQEQILRLKHAVNGLTQQLSLQRGRTESVRRKGQRLSKMIAGQFEDQRHWNSSQAGSHLVTGIKHAYDELKNKYHSLHEKYELLLKQESATREIQHLVYIDALQKQNKAFKERLESAATQEGFIGGNSKEIASFVIAQLKAERAKLVQRNKQMEGKYHMCRETLNDRNRKVTFLDKIIQQKDNKIHAVQRENKALRKKLKQEKETKGQKEAQQIGQIKQ